MPHRCRAPWWAWGLLALAQPACKQADPGQGAAASATAASSAAPTASVDFSLTGLKACDLYFAAVQGCLPKVDDATRKSLGQEVTQYRHQIAEAKTEAARGIVAVGCEAAREALADDGCK